MIDVSPGLGRRPNLADFLPAAGTPQLSHSSIASPGSPSPTRHRYSIVDTLWASAPPSTTTVILDYAELCSLSARRREGLPVCGVCGADYGDDPGMGGIARTGLLVGSVGGIWGIARSSTMASHSPALLPPYPQCQRTETSPSFTNTPSFSQVSGAGQGDDESVWRRRSTQSRPMIQLDRAGKARASS
ncbi:hypothetical protein C8F01DRAFT_575029 [Mycena amicta]|nr:hypothetical protein C8F01DRAFT_575029 [Mycena amicta]